MNELNNTPGSFWIEENSKQLRYNTEKNKPNNWIQPISVYEVGNTAQNKPYIKRGQPVSIGKLCELEGKMHSSNEANVVLTGPNNIWCIGIALEPGDCSNEYGLRDIHVLSSGKIEYDLNDTRTDLYYQPPNRDGKYIWTYEDVGKPVYVSTRNEGELTLELTDAYYNGTSVMVVGRLADAPLETDLSTSQTITIEVQPMGDPRGITNTTEFAIKLEIRKHKDKENTRRYGKKNPRKDDLLFVRIRNRDRDDQVVGSIINTEEDLVGEDDQHTPIGAFLVNIEEIVEDKIVDLEQFDNKTVMCHRLGIIEGKFNFSRNEIGKELFLCDGRMTTVNTSKNYEYKVGIVFDCNKVLVDCRPPRFINKFAALGTIRPAYRDRKSERFYSEPGFILIDNEIRKISLPNTNEGMIDNDKDFSELIQATIFYNIYEFSYHADFKKPFTEVDPKILHTLLKKGYFRFRENIFFLMHPDSEISAQIKYVMEGTREDLHYLWPEIKFDGRIQNSVYGIDIPVDHWVAELIGKEIKGIHNGNKYILILKDDNQFKLEKYKGDDENPFFESTGTRRTVGINNENTIIQLSLNSNVNNKTVYVYDKLVDAENVTVEDRTFHYNDFPESLQKLLEDEECSCCICKEGCQCDCRCKREKGCICKKEDKCKCVLNACDCPCVCPPCDCKCEECDEDNCDHNFCTCQDCNCIEHRCKCEPECQCDCRCESEEGCICKDEEKCNCKKDENCICTDWCNSCKEIIRDFIKDEKHLNMFFKDKYFVINPDRINDFDIEKFNKKESIIIKGFFKEKEKFAGNSRLSVEIYVDKEIEENEEIKSLLNPVLLKFERNIAGTIGEDGFLYGFTKNIIFKEIPENTSPGSETNKHLIYTYDNPIKFCLNEFVSLGYNMETAFNSESYDVRLCIIDRDNGDKLNYLAPGFFKNLEGKFYGYHWYVNEDKDTGSWFINFYEAPKGTRGRDLKNYLGITWPEGINREESTIEFSVFIRKQPTQYHNLFLNQLVNQFPWAPYSDNQYNLITGKKLFFNDRQEPLEDNKNPTHGSSIEISEISAHNKIGTKIERPIKHIKEEYITKPDQKRDILVKSISLDKKHPITCTYKFGEKPSDNKVLFNTSFSVDRLLLEDTYNIEGDEFFNKKLLKTFAILPFSSFIKYDNTVIASLQEEINIILTESITQNITGGLENYQIQISDGPASENKSEIQKNISLLFTNTHDTIDLQNSIAILSATFKELAVHFFDYEKAIVGEYSRFFGNKPTFDRYLGITIDEERKKFDDILDIGLLKHVFNLTNRFDTFMGTGTGTDLSAIIDRLYNIENLNEPFYTKIDNEINKNIIIHVGNWLEVSSNKSITDVIGGNWNDLNEDISILSIIGSWKNLNINFEDDTIRRPQLPPIPYPPPGTPIKQAPLNSLTIVEILNKFHEQINELEPAVVERLVDIVGNLKEEPDHNEIIDGPKNLWGQVYDIRDSFITFKDNIAPDNNETYSSFKFEGNKISELRKLEIEFNDRDITGTSKILGDNKEDLIFNLIPLGDNYLLISCVDGKMNFTSGNENIILEKFISLKNDINIDKNQLNMPVIINNKEQPYYMFLKQKIDIYNNNFVINSLPENYIYRINEFEIIHENCWTGDDVEYLIQKIDDYKSIYGGELFQIDNSGDTPRNISISEWLDTFDYRNVIKDLYNATEETRINFCEKINSGNTNESILAIIDYNLDNRNINNPEWPIVSPFKLTVYIPLYNEIHSEIKSLINNLNLIINNTSLSFIEWNKQIYEEYIELEKIAPGIYSSQKLFDTRIINEQRFNSTTDITINIETKTNVPEPFLESKLLSTESAGP